jgi:hypothetical protein
MTNILSTLRGSGVFCVKLVRNTSKLLSRILNFYSGHEAEDDSDAGDVTVIADSDGDSDAGDVPSSPPPTEAGFRWPSERSSFVPESASRCLILFISVSAEKFSDIFLLKGY